jgi:tetratricopeptide (TPR) repeat protein
MQESVKKYADDVRRSHAAVVKIRVGLNSGEVVVRAIGSDLHMDYTAVGQTTHLAARMEQIADPGAIVITPETLALAEGYVEVKSLGPVPVKGLADPVEVYELTGAGTARTRLQAAALRGLTRFVGRDAEVEHLRRVLGQADAGHGQVVAIVGEAGVGKSRLTYEFTHSHRVLDWLILETSSVSYGKATSYLPVIDLLKGYFKIGDRDDHREMRAKVLGRVLGLDRALEPLLPPLLALLDVPVEDAGWQTLDPPQRRQRTLDAIKRLLLRESQVQPLLVVFEDLHWIDGETQAVLDSLVDSPGSARLLLLVNYRPEYQHGWGSKTAYSQMRLDTLAVEIAGELLEALLGDDPGLAPLKQLLVKRGNPFFLEETVRTLVEMKALDGSRGRYRLTQPLQALQVPSTVQTILAARIDRLSPEDKGLLQTASVVGKDVPFTLLQAIAGLPEEALRGGLDRLQAAEFLYETGLFPDLEYTFKHALTHEVTYGSLLQERRRELHARIVDAVERLYADRLAEHVDRLAFHAVRGEVWEKATSYLKEVGQKAAARHAHPEAVASFEHALAALARLSQTPDRQAQAIDLRLDIRLSLVTLGDWGRVLVHLRQAEPLAEALGDQTRQAVIAGSLAHYFFLMHQYEQGREAAQRSLEFATRVGDLASGRLGRYVLGQLLYALGDYEPAITHFMRDIAMASPDGAERWRPGETVMWSVHERRWLAQSLAEVGRFAEGIAVATEAVALAEQADYPLGLVNALLALGFVLLRQGDVEQAVRVLERCAEASRRLNSRGILLTCATLLAGAYGLAGRVAEAREMLADPRTEPAIIPPTGMLAESCLLADSVDEARDLCPQELEFARARKARGREAWALHLLAELAAHREVFDVEAAEIHYRQALALASELGMRPLVAHCHLGLGKLYWRTGKHEQAREHLNTATTMYREMGMTYWLEQAEVQMNDGTP